MAEVATEPMETLPAGRGASAAAYIGSKMSADAPLSPVRPPGTPSGRPTKRVQTSQHNDQEPTWWLTVLQASVKGAEDKPAGEACVVLVAELALQVQALVTEMMGMWKAATLCEEDLKKALTEHMFVPYPKGGNNGAGSPASPSRRSVSMRKSAHYNARKSLAQVGGEFCADLLICKAFQGNPSKVYDVGPTVGSGTFGTVSKARHRQTGQIHAIKQIRRDQVSEDEIQKEIDILKVLDHPHILRLYYTFKDAEFIYLASELCSGGELYDALDEMGFFPEDVSAHLLRQIMASVSYLHGQNICHRDLKPANFLILRTADVAGMQLKLIDFGAATSFKDKDMTTKVCTAHYVAPEVLKRGELKYTEKVDVWSCGVILYMLLCGFMPFHHDDDIELLKLVKKGKFEFKPKPVWSKISPNAKDLINKMMTVKAVNRMTALEAFQHPWCQNEEEADGDIVDDEIVHSMRKFLTNNRLKRVALQVIARQVEDESIRKLRGIFMKIDTDHSGTLTAEEMDEAFRLLEMSEENRQEMSSLMKKLDADNSGSLEWTEFLAATLSPNLYSQEEVCRGAFQMLDVDGDGQLSMKDLQTLLGDHRTTNGNRQSTVELGLSSKGLNEIEHIMKEIDANGDGDCSFAEFLAFMQEAAPKNDETAVQLHWRLGKERRVALDITKHMGDISVLEAVIAADEAGDDVDSDDEHKDEGAKASKDAETPAEKEEDATCTKGDNDKDDK